MQPRRKISMIILILIGLALGFVMKRVGLGLLIGVVLGLLASGMMSKDKS